MIRLRVHTAAAGDSFLNTDALETAAAAIRNGGLVVIPTDTLYGLASSPFDALAIARLFDAKGRDAAQALPLIAADLDQVVEKIGALPARARRLAERYWPGPLTIVVPAPPQIVSAATGGTGRIGVRVPNHPVAVELCRLTGFPITATSANVSGRPASADPDEVVKGLGEMQAAIAVMLDSGATPGGPASTIVDVSEDEPRLVRAGAISWEAIQRV